MVVKCLLGFQRVSEQVVVVDLADPVIESQWLWLEGMEGDAELEQAEQFSERGVSKEGKVEGQSGNIGEGGL